MSIVIDADITPFERKMEQVRNTTQRVANQQIATINRASELSLLTLQAIGVTVDATFRIQVLAIRTAINTFIQTRAAIATANPMLAATTLLTGGVMLFLLKQQLTAIETGRAETSAEMAARYTLLRQAGGVYI